jgi:uncharacterized protein (TIGR00255 family)
MIRSMTGFGRGDAEGAVGRFSVEMRSVNNRYLDVQIKLPRSLAVLEPRIRKEVQDRFSRGRIDVFISRSGGDAPPVRLRPDHEIAGQYVAALQELKARHGLAGEVDLALVQGLPDVIAREEVREDSEVAWPVLAACLAAAMDGLAGMRGREGEALEKDIAGRLDAIGAMAAAVRARVPATVDVARQRMTDALARILREVPDPGRIAQEIAILAERTDVTEELTRLNSHGAQFRALVSAAGDEPTGRKLDFLTQELGREVNTIASKAMDAEISLLAVNMKAELEKIREQVQNIE